MVLISEDEYAQLQTMTKPTKNDTQPSQVEENDTQTGQVVEKVTKPNAVTEKNDTNRNDDESFSNTKSM